MLTESQFTWRWSARRFSWFNFFGGPMSVVATLCAASVLSEADAVGRPVAAGVAMLLLSYPLAVGLSVGRSWIAVSPDHLFVHRRGRTTSIARSAVTSIEGGLTRGGQFVIVEFELPPGGLRSRRSMWLPAASTLRYSKAEPFGKELREWAATGSSPSLKGVGLRLCDPEVIYPRMSVVAMVYGCWASFAGWVGLGPRRWQSSVASGATMVMLFLSVLALAIVISRCMAWGANRDVGTFLLGHRRAPACDVARRPRSLRRGPGLSSSRRSGLWTLKLVLFASRDVDRQRWNRWLAGACDGTGTAGGAGGPSEATDADAASATPTGSDVSTIPPPRRPDT